MKLAIVIPVLNEARLLPDRLSALADFRARGVTLIVVDGGSADGTADVARLGADAVVVAPRGRASQMNAGGWHPLARDADVLLFLHADTRLAANADELVKQAMRGDRLWGRFDVRIEGRHFLLPLVAKLMNFRSRWSGIATGDQAMFVRRSVWDAMGGFAPLPLMEDVEISQRLMKKGLPVCLEACVTTDGRRWDRRGFWRTVWLMWRLRADFALGSSTRELAKRYGYAPRAEADVAVMAKAPVPLEAKTRLEPLLGAAGAARAQRGFILRSLSTARLAGIGHVSLHCALGMHHRLFQLLAERWGIRCIPQSEGDIGQRMSAVMEGHFADFADAKVSAPPLLIIGTDCPVLTAEHLQRAADALLHNDAVVLPAEDGGYVLIGMRVSIPQIFERVDWSTPRVMSQTRERLESAGIPWQELPTLWDVDDPEDWQRWQDVLNPRGARAGFQPNS